MTTVPDRSGHTTGTSEFTRDARRMLAASVAAQLMGGTMAIGLFPLLMQSLGRSLGWSGTQLGALAGITLIFAAIGLPSWGYLVDRFGARPIVLWGALLTSLGFCGLAALTESMIQAGLTFAAAGFLSATSVAHVKAQALRFDRSRGVVLAILGMTVGVSFGITPLVGKWLLDAYGWRAVYATFALFPLCLSLPVSYVWFKPRDHQGELVGLPGGGHRGSTIGIALRSSQFWAIVFMAAASAFVFAGMQANFINFLGDRGIESQRAVNVLSLAVFGGLLCQLLTGWMLDRWRTPRAAMPFVGIALLGMVLLLVDRGIGATTWGVILLQSGVGGELSIIPYLTSRAFGGRHLARIFGSVMFIAQVLSGGSPLMMGTLHDRTGSYAYALPVFTVLLAVSLMMLFILGGARRLPLSPPAPP